MRKRRRQTVEIKETTARELDWMAKAQEFKSALIITENNLAVSERHVDDLFATVQKAGREAVAQAQEILELKAKLYDLMSK